MSPGYMNIIINVRFTISPTPASPPSCVHDHSAAVSVHSEDSACVHLTRVRSHLVQRVAVSVHRAFLSSSCCVQVSGSLHSSRACFRQSFRARSCAAETCPPWIWTASATRTGSCGRSTPRAAARGCWRWARSQAGQPVLLPENSFMESFLLKGINVMVTRVTEFEPMLLKSSRSL